MSQTNNNFTIDLVKVKGNANLLIEKCLQTAEDLLNQPDLTPKERLSVINTINSTLTTQEKLLTEYGYKKKEEIEVTLA